MENGSFCLGGGSSKPLLEMISNKRLELKIADKWVWKDSEPATFSVKSAYGLFMVEGGEEDSRMYKFFWRIKAFHSAHVTAWKVIENNVASKVNLERRGTRVESNLCCLFRASEESTNHLFFGCRVAWLIWNLC